MKAKDPQKIAAIYKATLNLVQTEGLAGIKMAKVAKASGVATGTLYIYFAGKTELLNSLYQKLKSEREVYLHPELATGPVKELLRKIWDDALLYRYENHLETLFMEQFYYSSYCNDESKSLSEKMTQGILQLLDRGKSEQIIKPIENPLLLCLLHGFLKETASQWRQQNKPLSDELFLTSFQLCWDAIRD